MKILENLDIWNITLLTHVEKYNAEWNVKSRDHVLQLLF